MKIWMTIFFLSLAKQILDPDRIRISLKSGIRIKKFWIRHTAVKASLCFQRVFITYKKNSTINVLFCRTPLPYN